jgi:hypothetical protein
MKLTLKQLTIAAMLATVSYAADASSAMKTPSPEGAASAASVPADDVQQGPKMATSGVVGAGKPWRCQYTIAVNGGFPTFTFCTVPVGYRFVIENISSMLNLATNSKMDFYWIGTTLGGKQEIDFITYPQRITNQYGTLMTMNQQVRLYADGGTEIKAALQGNFNFQTDGLWTTLTGHLEAQ